MRYRDRRHAGVLLAEAVAELEPVDPVVYALPRGGVPVGFEVAAALSCPLDLLVVRKVGVPYHPELAMGAIAEGGVVIRNSQVIDHALIEEDEFAAVVEAEHRELTRRVELYRGDLAAVPPNGHTAIVVDDGLATGSTALAAVSVLRRWGAAATWLAVPVAPRETLPALQKSTERVIVLQQPRHFAAVGVWYRDFTQTTDDEVRNLLSASRLA